MISDSFNYWILSTLFLSVAYLAKNYQHNRLKKLHDSFLLDSGKLLMGVVDSYKNNTEATKDLCDSLKILNDRCDAYNHRLNELTAAVKNPR